MKIPRSISCVDLSRFNLFANMIERDTRTTDVQKMVLKLKAWKYYASVKGFSLFVELPKVY